ncbi:carboxylesterase family protein [Marinimicrobium agarilyticum]|uniref:carboxylesterase family protein n=1 Tax=Marinimicrobium agarilyticum TaxID=306546 RepID=UPI00041B59CE|nr:carboxylesterase family protein [Marinimicrobium agarilyticum]
MKNLLFLCLCLTSSLSFAQVIDSKVLDEGGSGPYKAIAATEKSLPEYVVYRPENLAQAAKSEGPLPVVVFANGGCNDTSFPFERMLSEVASHGYVVIALGKMQRSLDDRPLKKAGNEMMTAAVDWVTAQAAAKQSDYYEKVALEHIASAGQSCGGAQVLATASDPRFTTFMMFNSGIGDMTMAEASRSSLANLHAPVIYLVGGETDVATENAILDYERIDHVPVVLANHQTAGHSGTFEQANGGSFAALALKWLDWQLKGQSDQAKVFMQEEPEAFPEWKLRSKNFTMDRVTVEQGTLQGKTEGELTVFKGVPFAKPPVGELRWKAPQPPESWSGIRQALEYAPSPIQAGEPPAGKSEDSLYLNIWTPADADTDELPVLVWIYGGGFSFGSSADPLTEGSTLAKKGVVLVTISYRVGPLGFLAHPELSAESPNNVSGNYGLLDQIAALKWIKSNIGAFGGDPDQVTIFGESAGGISVSMLTASPLAEGLFQGAISQSGGSFGPTRKPNYPGENMNTLAQAEADGVKYVESFGVSSIDELREMDAEALIPQQWSMPGGWPIVDGHVIPDDQYKLYQKGDYNDVPVIVGYNSDEGLSFVRSDDPKAFVEGIETRFGPFAEPLMDAYGISETEVTRNARNLIRDAAFGWHTWSWARLQAQQDGAPAYLYYFDQNPSFPEDSPRHNHGSPHGQEIAYVFQRVDPNSPDAMASDPVIAEAMATYWTNFAKSGNPNGEGLPKWPEFEPGSSSVMYFQQEPKLGPVPDRKALKVLNEYFQWRRTPEGEEWANQ